MTDRLSMMTSIQEMVRDLIDLRKRGLLQTGDAVENYLIGWADETRRIFDRDNKGGLYGA